MSYPPLDPGDFEPGELSPADRLAYYLRLTHLKFIAHDACDNQEEDRLLRILSDLWHSTRDEEERSHMELCAQLIYATRYPDRVADVAAYAHVVNPYGTLKGAAMQRSPPTVEPPKETFVTRGVLGVLKRLRIG